MLGQEFNIIKNPGSYNSQLGVPLSVWQMQNHHQLGIFEAGVSAPDEMEKLERIIQPTLGVFTTIGPAHDENFPDWHLKIEEKLKLFKHTDKLIYCADHEPIAKAVKSSKLKGVSWGFSSSADIVCRSKTTYIFNDGNGVAEIHFPFSDAASIENASHCVAVMLVLQYDYRTIQQRIHLLRSVPMRLELKEGLHQSQLVDDTYNNDLAGLQMSLEFLKNQQQKNGRVVVLSDILQSGLNDEVLVKRIADLINSSRLEHFIGIGPAISRHKDFFQVPSSFFLSTEAFLNALDSQRFHQQIISKGHDSFQLKELLSNCRRKYMEQ